jgi:spermidine/putrescine transport system ATP-binding protein
LIKRSGQLVFAALDGLLTGRSPLPRSPRAERAARLPPAATGPAELSVDGIWKAFDGPPVLRDIRFTVGGGEFMALLGPSGCGKTTLLRIIAGLERADAGEVALCGRRITDLPANHRPVNTVFQSYALFPHLSVRENVAFGLRSRRFPASQVDQRVTAALQMLQMEAFASRYPHQLSGGQKQRVALARALVNEPELLLLDEPMSALDAKLRAEVQLELRRLQRRLGKTFILVTHDQDEAMSVCDRIIVMHQGSIEQIGTPAEVYERPVNRFVAEFLGSANLLTASRYDGRFRTAHGELQTGESPPWKRGTLAIRPERICVCTHRPEHNAVCGRIRELVYRGDHVDLFVEPGPLRVRTTARPHLRVGAEIWLELPAEHLVPLQD